MWLRASHLVLAVCSQCSGDTGAVLGTEQLAGLGDKMVAVSSSNTTWGSACSRDHITNRFRTQRMVIFIKLKKKKKLYFFCKKSPIEL